MSYNSTSRRILPAAPGASERGNAYAVTAPEHQCEEEWCTTLCSDTSVFCLVHAQRRVQTDRGAPSSLSSDEKQARFSSAPILVAATEKLYALPQRLPRVQKYQDSKSLGGTSRILVAFRPTGILVVRQNFCNVLERSYRPILLEVLASSTV